LRRPKLALYALCQNDEISRFLNWFPLFNPAMKAALLTNDFRSAVDRDSAERVFGDQLAHTDAADSLNRLLYLDTTLWLPDDLLARGDKTSMAASLEARVPLLDHKLVEFAATLPTRLKVRGLARKYLLKKVSRAWLPDAIIDRPKKGFPIPLSMWFRKDARTFVRDLLAPAAIRRRGLFDPRCVQALIEENETRDHGSFLWALVSVELWYRQFIDSPVRVDAHVPAHRTAGDGRRAALRSACL
jgi:asparagine synthase (glutamine-hydrolysing)